MNYLAIATIALIVPVIAIGSTLLEESERYVLILDDDHKSSDNIYLEFYEIDAKKNRQVIVDEGFFFLEGQEYSIITEWKGNFLKNDKLFFMAGKIENFDEKIDVFLMGKFLKKTIDGSLYDLTVHIHSDIPIEFQTKAEIIGITPKVISKEIETKKPIDLLFLIKDTHHRFQDQDYAFTTKLYDKKLNPTNEWDVKGGAISDAEIIVQAIDLDGNVLQETKGTTNEFGWFEGRFPIGMTFPRGEYLVLYTAKYQNNIAESQKPLYVFEVKTHAHTGHFFPTSDISRGKWSDNKGNQNQLMFDDLDEYNARIGAFSSIDNSDYVHSKNLGKKDAFDSDTFHVRITTNAGVTTDHEHIIAYTLGKDESGGSEISFTITLSEGTKEISQWIHLNVTEGFSLVKNSLTREQVESISDYNNLNLNFTAWCDPCMGGNDKRNGQVSWIHMIV